VYAGRYLKVVCRVVDVQAFSLDVARREKSM
jgi:hypothetical protein